MPGFLLCPKGCETMTRNYIVFKCKACGCEFAMPKEQMTTTTNYVGCPLNGRHNATVVIGSYDNLNECMDHDKYKIEHGVVKQKR